MSLAAKPGSVYHTAGRALVALLVLFLPVAFLFKANSFWFDEVFTASMIQDTMYNQITEWYKQDVHPPLYTLALRVWSRLYPFSEGYYRLFSLLIYGSALFLYIWYSRGWPLIRFLIGLVAIFTPLAAMYALEVRSYALLHALCLLAALEYLRHGEMRNGCRVALALLSFTHLFGLVIASCLLGIDWLLDKQKKLGFRHLTVTLLPIIPACLFYVWLLLYGNLLSMSGGSFWIQTSPKEALRLIRDHVLPFGYLYYSRMLIVLALLGVFAIHARTRPSKPWLVLACTLVCALGMLYALNFHTPIFSRRYLLAFQPLSGLLAAGLISAHITSRLYRIGCYMIVAGCLAFGLKRQHEMLTIKTYPFQALREQAGAALATGLPVYHIQSYNMRFFSQHIQQALANFYYWKQNGQKDTIPLIQIADLRQFRPPFCVTATGLIQKEQYTLLQTLKAIGRTDSLPLVSQLNQQWVYIVRQPMLPEQKPLP